MPHLKSQAAVECLVDTVALHHLDRHQTRRDGGVPTVSVLAGPPPIATAVWQKWNAVQSRSYVVVTEPAVESIVRQWTDRLRQERDLLADAFTYVAHHASQSPGELRHTFGLKTAYQQALFFGQTFGTASQSDTELVCQQLLDASAKIEPMELSALILALYAPFTGCEQPWIAMMAALMKLIPSREALSLLLVQPDSADKAADWINPASRSLIQITTVMPCLPVALAVDQSDLESFLNSGSDSRVSAMLREGVVHLRSPSESDIQTQPHPSSDSKQRVVEDSMPRPVMNGCTGALFTTPELSPAETAIPPRTLAEDDAARSAAERLLFARLESLPETAGLFRLNDKLAAPFGPWQEMEVDLLCRQHRIAIEIDGYYHFQDPEAYRRDRRKDLLLQQLGFIVIRQLADDVVTRLDTILDTILTTISQQRTK